MPAAITTTSSQLSITPQSLPFLDKLASCSPYTYRRRIHRSTQHKADCPCLHSTRPILRPVQVLRPRSPSCLPSFPPPSSNASINPRARLCTHAALDSHVPRVDRRLYRATLVQNLMPQLVPTPLLTLASPLDLCHGCIWLYLARIPPGLLEPPTPRSGGIDSSARTQD